MSMSPLSRPAQISASEAAEVLALLGKKPRKKSGASRAKRATGYFNRLMNKNSKTLSVHEKKAIRDLQRRTSHGTLSSYCKDPRKIKSKYSRRTRTLKKGKRAGQKVLSPSCIKKDTRDERKNMERYGHSAKIAQKVAGYQHLSRRFEGHRKMYKFPRSAVGRSQPKSGVVWKHGAVQTAGGLTAEDLEVNKRGKLVIAAKSEKAQDRYTGDEDLQDRLAAGRTKCVKTLMRRIENGQKLKKKGQYHLIANQSKALGITMSPKVQKVVSSVVYRRSPRFQ